MSAEGKKGGGYEQYLLDQYIRDVFPDAYRPRLRGVHDNGDFANVGEWLIEAKKRERWQLPLWIKQVMGKKERALARGETRSKHAWMILFAMDKRKLPYDLVVLPTEILFNLLTELKDAHEELRRRGGEFTYKGSPRFGDGKETE